MSKREALVKEEAYRLGFTLCGIARATEADHFDRYEAWLQRGYHGAMGYLADQAPARQHPRSILDPVRSVIVVALDDTTPRRDDPPASSDHLPAIPARIARFAVGRDYHQAIWRRLDELRAFLEWEVPGCRTRGVADTAPLLERDFARRAGLGWVGKNTMLINKHRGSYLLLGAVLTDADLNPDEPHWADHCGTCTACQTACPTDAFPAPGVLDARRCISYLNIELKGRLSDEQKRMVGDWLYGCDICQDVCPWNRKDETAAVAVDARDILALDSAGFRERFGATTMTRARRKGLARNAAIVLGNSGDPAGLPALQAALNDADASVRDAAAWAIERITGQRPAALAPNATAHP